MNALKNRSNFWVFGWLVVAIVLASQRSFWGDELIRVGQSRHGFIQAFRDLFTEPSPFAPGETFLIGFFRILFDGLLPTEIWARLPGILFGGISVFIATRIALTSTQFLPWLIAFSAPLFNLALEARPYGSLFASGAVATAVLWFFPGSFFEKKASPFQEPRRWLLGLILFHQLFGHLYGICFVAFALLLRRRWIAAVLSVIYVGVVLAQYKLSLQGGSTFPLAGDLLRQIFGALGNPHRATMILLPMSTLGLFVLLHQKRALAIELLLLFAAAVLGPLAASHRGGYFFSPRQIVGGSFVFLFFAAFGFHWITRWIRNPIIVPRNAMLAQISQILFFFGFFSASVIPWARVSLFKIPPFPNQPFHKFKQIAETVEKEKLTNVLMIDPCNEGPLHYYFERQFRMPAKAPVSLEREGLKLQMRCWDNPEFCLYSLLDFAYCSSESSAFEKPGPEADLIQSTDPLFQTIVHGFVEFKPDGRRAVRDW